ncbi:hypothetical protein SAMN02745702_00432 [Desulfobaculum bizertense DSM 18034]|uniref:Uncharacterized protein n=1 Tax=Desulfobaculum bizertense DSM 18034 TaxID=1121442 RepID=A0A1T4VJB8_9BACT|nr:hypothetical protein SAMN02745702_00432 [Desulfobaculum bizertense DSM 18034]
MQKAPQRGAFFCGIMAGWGGREDWGVDGWVGRLGVDGRVGENRGQPRTPRKGMIPLRILIEFKSRASFACTAFKLG